MTETIAILGATGVYARHLIPRLAARGYRARALVRRPEAAAVARSCGAEIRVADMFDGDALADALAGCSVGVNLATSLPGPSGRGHFDANDRLREHGTPIWLAACQRAGITRVIQQSIAMVNAGASDAWCDEDTPFAGSRDDTAGRAIHAALAMEDAVRRSNLDWIILRGALFYGPGTGFDDDWFARAAAGKLRMPDADAYVSLIHIADMAAATLAALERWPSRQILAIADDQPPRWRELLTYVARVAGADEPASGGQLRFPSFRIRNARARAALAWAPFYPDYRAGVAR